MRLKREYDDRGTMVGMTEAGAVRLMCVVLFQTTHAMKLTAYWDQSVW